MADTSRAQALFDADPEVQRIQAYVRQRPNDPTAARYASEQLRLYLRRTPALQQVLAALPAERSRSTGWGLDLRTGKLAEGTGNNPWVTLLIGGAMLGGAAGLGAVLPAVGAAGVAGGAAAGGGSAALPSASIAGLHAAAPGAVTAGAGGATAATSGAAMSWLDDFFNPTNILKYGIPVLGDVLGQRAQSNAQNEATRAQAEYLEKALEAAREEQQYRRGFDENERDYSRGRYTEERDYGRGQYANYLGRLSPYSSAGADAVGRASALLTTSRYRPEGQTIPGAAPVSAPPAGGGETITLISPNGERADVPRMHVEHFTRLGARRA